jgi:hypothetical protein
MGGDGQARSLRASAPGSRRGSQCCRQSKRIVHPALPFILQSLGVPVLHTAAMMNESKIMAMLADYGADINSIDNVIFFFCVLAAI